MHHASTTYCVASIRPYQIDLMFHGSGRVFFWKIEKKNAHIQYSLASFPGLRAFVDNTTNYRAASDERAKAWEQG